MTNNIMQEIAIEKIQISGTASQQARRKHFKHGELEDLISSIATYGVLQPIIVRPAPRSVCLNHLPSDPTHKLVAGERRFLAAGEVGLETIPAVVRDLTDEQVIEVQLIENLQRKDLHPMQEAEGYQELIKKYGHPVEELHERVGKSRSYVYGRLKLLALCARARDAFYDDNISASVGLLIARIPSDKLQAEALQEILDEDLSVRLVRELIQQHYMLRLKDAPFPKGDAKLNGGAGPCTTCPKRTGNQAELFDDIKSADVCTDPPCFEAKVRAFGQRRIEQARADGRPVITGAAAKKLFQYDSLAYNAPYKALDDKNYSDGKSRTNRQIVGKDAEVTLIQDPKSGAIIETVPASAVKAVLNKNRKGSNERPSNPQADAQRKAKLEKKFRRELYMALRPRLQASTYPELARFVLEEIDHDRTKIVADVRGVEPVIAKGYGHDYKDYQKALKEHLAALEVDQVISFITDCLYASELLVSTYGTGKPTRLLAAAAAQKFDVKALRKSLRPPTKKAKKKTAKARTNKKKAA